MQTRRQLAYHKRENTTGALYLRLNWEREDSGVQCTYRKVSLRDGKGVKRGKQPGSSGPLVCQQCENGAVTMLSNPSHDTSKKTGKIYTDTADKEYNFD
jgi:hypothetical protein